MLPAPAKAVLRYARRNFIAWDQALNAALGGEPDQTISYRAAVAVQRGSRVACLVCRLLDLVERGHCRLVREARDTRATIVASPPAA